jgi:chromosome segregation ATPase
LETRLHELRDRARRLKEIDGPKSEMEEVHMQIARTEAMLRKLQGQRDERGGDPRPDKNPDADKLAMAADRIKHLRMAAEHLMAAEARDLAKQLMEKAEAMERELREAKARMAEGGPRQRGGQGSDGVGELREEIERLRAEVRELREQLNRRGPPDLPRKR